MASRRRHPRACLLPRASAAVQRSAVASQPRRVLHSRSRAAIVPASASDEGTAGPSTHSARDRPRSTGCSAVARVAVTVRTPCSIRDQIHARTTPTHCKQQPQPQPQPRNSGR